MDHNYNIFDLHVFRDVYRCEGCGCEFVTKFKKYMLCSACLKDVREDIHKKMMIDPDYSKLFIKPNKSHW